MNIEVALLGAAVACGLLACASAGVAGDGAGGAAAIPGDAWQRIAPAEAAMDKKLLDKARDYALAGGGSGCVIRGGRLVYSWGDQEKLYDLKSTTKSIAVTALGLALADGRMKLDDLAGKYHKELAAPAGTLAAHGWAQKITLLQLATQTAGFEKPGGYEIGRASCRERV